MKNHKVWLKISESFPNRTLDQVRNRWKYLTSKYKEVKDNMSSRETGKKKKNFKFFTEMDELFHADPNIDPLVCDSDNAMATFPTVLQDGESFNTSRNVEEALDDDVDAGENSSTSGTNTSTEATQDRKKKEKKRKNRDDELLEELKTKRNSYESIQKEKLKVQQRGIEVLERIAQSFETYVQKM